MEKILSLHHEGQTALITIQNPPANALSSQLLTELNDMFDELEQNEEVRAIVIHGEGRFFSAGADIKEFTTLQEESDYASLADRGQQVFERIEQCPKPVIASIHGAALGGGLELAMSCDIRIATKDAKLGLPELNLGIIPGFGGTQRLPRYVGSAKALEMMGTAEPITGEEAFACGLVTKLAETEEEALAVAKTLAGKFAAKSPKSLEYVLDLLNATKLYSYDGGMKLEAKKFGEVFQSNDAKEGIQAFIEKRKPNFKGE
ncbi:putative enoyl-CoA hydratase [Bacillus safensis]|uniref:enoyl-CoA hydratase n=1 Tax=Bacillus TaxID=1386 RepID=UPI0005975016|nr:enoyl-CoA hydratase [Bacillus safensis]KIL15716.1 Enoyl-CoA hydratase [Bacillus safensis]CUB15671.1 putative enoyl-CoA hydratase [Bacillus safensis]